MGKAKTKSVTMEQPANWIELHHKKMLALVNSIKVGNIISRASNCGGAYYYRVTNIINGCSEPILAKQFKTFVLDYIGRKEDIENYNGSIFYYGDILPYAQMQRDESYAKYVTHDELRSRGWSDAAIKQLAEPTTYLDDSKSDMKLNKLYGEVEVPINARIKQNRRKKECTEC